MISTDSGAEQSPARALGASLASCRDPEPGVRPQMRAKESVLRQVLVPQRTEAVELLGSVPTGRVQCIAIASSQKEKTLSADAASCGANGRISAPASLR